MVTQRQFGSDMCDLFQEHITCAWAARGMKGVLRTWLSVGNDLWQIVLPYEVSRLLVTVPAVLGAAFSLLLFVAGFAFFESIASARGASGHPVSVGAHKLWVDCSGHPSQVTVILENGLGAGHETWQAAQSKVAQFAKVCSYDRSGEGQSDPPTKPQTPNTVVDDLHRLLMIEHIPGPYLLVGASLGGIYVRHFADRYPDLLSGMVLVDSSHEEQYSHYFAISPAIAQRWSTQDGRFDEKEFLQRSGQFESAQKLQWHHDFPLIILEHQRLRGPALTEADRLAADWHLLQVDLAGRSQYGELREIHSGHFIPGEQPDAVVQAVRDVLGKVQEHKNEPAQHQSQPKKIYYSCGIPPDGQIAIQFDDEKRQRMTLYTFQNKSHKLVRIEKSAERIVFRDNDSVTVVMKGSQKCTLIIYDRVYDCRNRNIE